MTLDTSSLGTLTRSLHKIHPALVLPLIAVGGWLLAPPLAGGDADKQGQIDPVIATTGTAPGLGTRSAEANPQPQFGTVATVAPALAAPASGGLLSNLFGGNQSSNNGDGGSAPGSGSRSKPQAQTQASPAPASKGIAPVHAAATPASSGPGPTTPRVVAMPRSTPPPGTPPVAVMPRPVMPSPPVVVQPVPPPAPVMRPPVVAVLPILPFILGHAPVGRAPIAAARGRR